MSFYDTTGIYSPGQLFDTPNALVGNNGIQAKPIGAGGSSYGNTPVQISGDDKSQYSVIEPEGKPALVSDNPNAINNYKNIVDRQNLVSSAEVASIVGGAALAGMGGAAAGAGGGGGAADLGVTGGLDTATTAADVGAGAAGAAPGIDEMIVTGTAAPGIASDIATFTAPITEAVAGEQTFLPNEPGTPGTPDQTTQPVDPNNPDVMTVVGSQPGAPALDAATIAANDAIAAEAGLGGTPTDEMTVTGQNPNVGPGAGTILSDVAAGAGALNALGVGSNSSFLPATNDASVQSFNDVMSGLGIQPGPALAEDPYGGPLLGGGGGGYDYLDDPNAADSSDVLQSGGGGGGPAAPAAAPPGGGGGGGGAPGAGGGGGGGATPGLGAKLAGIFKNPKNLAGIGIEGLSLLQGLKKPQLPGAAKTALGNANAMTANANAVIASGGTATPVWQQQKAAIDAQINQSIENQKRAIQQSAVNSGQGGAIGPNGELSGPVVQQINAMTQKMEQQRQQMYLAAQSQNIQQAMNELTGGNQVLDQVAKMQLQQDDSSKALAGELANLGFQLFGFNPKKGP